MWTHYLKTAWRSLWKQKGFTVINILGLAIGITCCLLILMYVWDESSYDRFFDKGERIFRVGLERKYPGRESFYAIIPASYAQAIKDECAEVEEVTRLFYFQDFTPIYKIGTTTFEEAKTIWADSTFFDLFNLPVLKGDAHAALVKPNGVIITEHVAKKYFGNEDPLGKILDIPNTEDDLVVSAVCSDVPANSHLLFDLVVSSKNLGFLNEPNFVSFSAYTYLLLKPGASWEAVEKRMPEIVRKYASGQIQREFGVTYDDYVKSGNGYRYFLQALPDIYLRSNLESEIRPPGSLTRVRIFTAVAFFILLIACINFVNLATARSTERAKEVGIRRTLGSMRTQVAGQFLMEAVMISFLGMLLSIILLYYLLPVFNNLSGKSFQISQILNLRTLPGFLTLGILTGLLAGIYPAFILSGFEPVSVLKGKLSASLHGIRLRNGLVVFQFAISVALIFSTIVAFNQLHFIRTKELGFNESQILTIKGTGDLDNKTETFRQELLKMPGVESVGSCNAMPGGAFFGISFSKEGDKEPLFGRGVFVDDTYIDCMQIQLSAGRGFSRDHNDTLAVILNETAVKELGIEDPIGKRLLSTNDFLQRGKVEKPLFEIIGVMKDFHFQSLHQRITPLFFILNNTPSGANNLLSLRVGPGQIESTVPAVEKLWNKFLPDHPFHFSFLDADLTQLYQAEQVAQRVFGLFSILAIFIASIGLLGLAAYITRQRTREIGIRKVLGATSADIISLLSKNFLRLVLIAAVLAFPLAWWGMHRWLENFAYRIDIQWWVFVAVATIALLTALITVSLQALRAALANPVSALKQE